ncbi:MAG TPA: hypothetical protein PLU53_03150 [Bacteroidia bacterium]|nr:hypothetical protein [Bacteroidia bacterium]
MKNFLAILSLVCFVAFASHAQTPQTKSADAKKEVSVSKTDDKAATPACCSKANKACCKNNSSAKNCTPEQKADCAKAGAEAKVEKAAVKGESSKMQVAPESK